MYVRVRTSSSAVCMATRICGKSPFQRNTIYGTARLLSVPCCFLFKLLESFKCLFRAKSCCSPIEWQKFSHQNEMKSKKKARNSSQVKSHFSYKFKMNKISYKQQFTLPRPKGCLSSKQIMIVRSGILVAHDFCLLLSVCPLLFVEARLIIALILQSKI